MQYRRAVYAVLFLTSFFFMACAGNPTIRDTQNSLSMMKGYSEVWLDHKDLQVDFKGGMDDNVDRLKNIAILRAAEIGKERRFERFVIKRTSDQTIIDGVTPSGDKYLPVEKLKASVVVKFIDSKDPEYAQAFDVDEKIAEILKKLNKK